MSKQLSPWLGAMVPLPSAAQTSAAHTDSSSSTRLRPGRPRSVYSLHTLFLAVAALAGTALLSACGGGGSSADSSADDTSAVAPPATISEAPRTAPAIPVVPQPRYAASGPGSYQDALAQYTRVGEALHGQ